MPSKNPRFEQKAVNALSDEQLYVSKDLYTEGGKVDSGVASSTQNSTIYTEGGKVSPPQTEEPTTSVPKRARETKKRK